MGSVASSTDELDDRETTQKMQLPQTSSAHDRLTPSPSLLHAGSQVRAPQPIRISSLQSHLLAPVLVVSPTVVFHNSGRSTGERVLCAHILITALLVCAHRCPGHGVLSSSGTAVAFRVRCGRQARLLFYAGHTCQDAAKGGVRDLRATAADKLCFSPLVSVSMVLLQRWEAAGGCAHPVRLPQASL